MGTKKTKEGAPHMIAKLDPREVSRIAAEAVADAKRTHQQWHWETKKTACPWGCGDGSGIVAK